MPMWVCTQTVVEPILAGRWFADGAGGSNPCRSSGPSAVVSGDCWTCSGQLAVDTVQGGKLSALRHKSTRPQLQPRPLDLFQNIPSLSGPKVRLGLAVVLINVVADGLL